jgi:hypothetical protein
MNNNNLLTINEVNQFKKHSEIDRFSQEKLKKIEFVFDQLLKE